MAKNININLNAKYTIVEDTPITTSLLLAWTQEVALALHIPTDHKWVDDVTVQLMARNHGMTTYKDSFQLAVRREFNRLLWEG